MADYKKATSLISQNPQRVRSIGPRPVILVSDAEAVLGMRFPPSYRRFLLELGACEVSPVEFYGIPGTDLVSNPYPLGIRQTLSLRQKCKFPRDLLVVGGVGDGSLYCLEVREDGCEGRVVAVVPGQEPIVRDPVGTDFGEFFLGQIQQALALRAMSPAEKQRALGPRHSGNLPG
jgi:hypothetical protein